MRTQRTACGISRCQIVKVCGKWWDIVIPLVVSRESSDPSNIIEPSFDTINERVESETQPNEVPNVTSQNWKANMTQQKEKMLEQKIINLTRSFIENDPTEKLLNFLAREKTEAPEGTRQKWCRWCFKSIILLITVKLIPPKYLEVCITKIGRAVYLTEIPMIPNLNPQYHNQINQRPVAQGASEYLHVNS